MSGSKPRRRSQRPATTPEGRENQLISLAYDAAEDLFLNGNAPAQVINHFLKAGSSRDALEKARLEKENLLMSAKIEQIQSQQKMEDLYQQAMAAFTEYSGQDEVYDD